MVGAAPLTLVRTGRGRLLHDLRRHGHDAWWLRRLGVCASTESELSQWLVQQPWSGLSPRAVLADHQIRGHGQYGRRWMAPMGGVWLSAALPWPQQQCSTGLFGLTVALALAEQVESTGLQVSIKWPNDLMIECCAHSTAPASWRLSPTWWSVRPSSVSGLHRWLIQARESPGKCEVSAWTDVCFWNRGPGGPAGPVGQTVLSRISRVSLDETVLIRWFCVGLPHRFCCPFLPCRGQ